MKKLSISLLIGLSLLTVGCNNKDKEEIKELQEQVNKLEQQVQDNDKEEISEEESKDFVCPVCGGVNTCPEYGECTRMNYCEICGQLDWYEYLDEVVDSNGYVTYVHHEPCFHAGTDTVTDAEPYCYCKYCNEPIYNQSDEYHVQGDENTSLCYYCYNVLNNHNANECEPCPGCGKVWWPCASCPNCGYQPMSDLN